MRQFVRSGLTASLVVVLGAVAGAQAPKPAPAQPPAKSATKAAIPPRPAILDQVLGTVNGEPIIREELIFVFQSADTHPDTETEMYRMGMEQLVNHKLVKQYLQKQKALDVTEKEIDALFSDFAEKIKKNGEDVYVALASHGVTVAQVREQMQSELRLNKYADAVATDVNLKKFQADNKDFFNNTQVMASHIVLRVEPGASPADKEKVKQRLIAIKRDIDSNKITFAGAADKYSEDDGNKTSPRGGDIGYFTRKQIDPKFTDVAFALKMGTISEPVETAYGYHLILVTDRKEGAPIDFEQKRGYIRNAYLADVMERIIVAERKTAKVDIKPMPSDLFAKAAPPQQGPATGPAGSPAPPTTKPATPK